MTRMHTVSTQLTKAEYLHLSEWAGRHRVSLSRGLRMCLDRCIRDGLPFDLTTFRIRFESLLNHADPGRPETLIGGPPQREWRPDADGR